ncbi:uncharacterized protein LOC135805880 [Sycon ciliatum]|uniref:uncharacterized protein LOC135805880 n=1 Tax=Sycon ciliatum TaxID=27933 RepID=UPI0031F6DDAA
MGESSSEAQMKLLCSLPGIEHSLVGVVQTLSTLATESANRAARMSRRISELSSEVKGLKEELVTLKASAIAKPMSSRPKAVGAGRTTTSGNSSTAVTGGKVQHRSTDPAHRSTCTGHSAETPLTTPVATDSAGDAPCTNTGSSEAHAAATANYTEVHTAAATADEKHNTGNSGQDAKGVQSKGQSHVVPPMDDEDDAWTLVSHDKPRKPKKKVIFVGNLKAGTTEEQLATYLHRRIAAAALPNFPLHSVTILEKRPLNNSRLTVSGRVMINAQDAGYLLAKNLWPGRVYSRLWKFDADRNSNGRATSGEDIGDSIDHSTSTPSTGTVS